jgi:hypothetical protein
MGPSNLMLILYAAVIILVAGLGGWVLGRVKTRSRVLALIWAVFPALIYVGWSGITLALSTAAPWQQQIVWVLLGLSYLFFPIVVWAGAALAGYFVGRLRDQAQT